MPAQGSAAPGVACSVRLDALGRGRGLALRIVRAHQVDPAGLPPLAPPEADEDERARAIMARMVARHGAPSLEDYRRAYAGFGAEWPGDDEIRRRHLVAPDAAA